MSKYFILIFLFLSFNLSAEIVKKIDVQGNERISKETIKVYGNITLNNNYSTFDLNNILKDLYNTEFFEDVKISLSNGTLNIAVKEYPTINFISIEGEKSSTTKEKILEILQLKEQSSFIKNKLTEDIATLKKIYASMGFNFLNVETKIEKFDNNRINLLYFLEKDKKTNISKISFTGDKKIKDKRLRDLIVSEEKKFWKFLSKNTFLSYRNIELDKRLLINYYKSLGYYDVQVLSNNAEVSKDNLTTLTYTINAGNRYIVTKISTNVSDVLDKKLFIPLEDEYKKIVGNYYSPFSVKNLLDGLDELIANNDLQFIEHSVNEILDKETLEIQINIFEGKKLSVEKINILGNTVTNESVIRAELQLDEGDPFNQLKLDQSIANLKSRNLFAEVNKKITDGTIKNQKIIEISVEEKPTGEISAGAGIGTDGGSFGFTVKENNWLGKGVNVATTLNLSTDTFAGSFDVTNPNYNFSGNSLNYFISNATNDKSDSGYKNNISTTGIGFSFEQYKNIYFSPSLAFSYDDLKVQDSASEALKKQKGTFSDLSLGYGISKDVRDRTYASTEGYRLGFNQALPIYADSPYVKNTFNFIQYKSFSEDTIGKFKFYASAINGLQDKDVRISKRLYLPSSKLRGFKKGGIGPKDGKDYVGGNYAVATNFEMNLPNLIPESAKIDLGFFLDIGNLWKVDYDDKINDSFKVRSSTGINANWLSPVGPMTFTFARNLSKANTDQVESFSFNLGTTF
jgi:outer membrane protein insertion porin family